MVSKGLHIFVGQTTTMKVYIDYPANRTLTVRKQFTTNRERTLYLRKWLKKNNVESPCHDYSDYVVEFVETYDDNNQYWIVGS